MAGLAPLDPLVKLDTIADVAVTGDKSVADTSTTGGLHRLGQLVSLPDLTS